MTTHTFEADIQKLLHLIIQNVYSNRDVFIRELISNASDAIDKLRICKMNENEQIFEDYKIEIRIDTENKFISIKDNGIGMNEEDLKKNLSTIAHSGTQDFNELYKNVKEDNQLIGQFGVGFYACFLVASKVDVLTRKRKEDKGYKWSSDGISEYNIETVNDISGHGTEIVLYLKEDSAEYSKTDNLKKIIKQYSDFISYPILLWVEKEKEEEQEEEEIVEDNNDEEKVVCEDIEKDTKEDQPSKPKKIVKYHEWEIVNNKKPLWYKEPSEITEDEYHELYSNIVNNTYEKPVHYKHFKAEGKNEFQGIFYITSKPNYMGQMTNNNGNIKLYVKKVLILENCGRELIPEWMNFVYGIVDSNDLPLNVSREMLQTNVTVQNMKKYIKKQVIKMIVDFKENNRDKFIEFYKEYSKSLKWAITDNEDKLKSVLLWNHNHDENKLITFDEYIENHLIENQKQIFYLTGDSYENCKRSIFLEKFNAHNICVLFFIDPIDEFLGQRLDKYNDYEFVNIAKDFKSELFDNNDDAKNDEDLKDNEFFKHIKEVLKDKIEDVRISKLLKDSPACITSAKYGWSGHMEKVMQSQPLQNNQMFQFQKGKRIMELNMEHPIIQKLESFFTEKSEQIDAKIDLLYQTALLQSGFTLDDLNEYSSLIYNNLF